ncbi:pyridoxamine 5'-phosphate oxidase family protein [Novosphingobium sp. FKTRR1]|uniref:pyridoxamine 5'-phosphate oxidase family protein n=1 Tax=unclassified Novosphingobium TaxID=2644732 RepID=UPI001CEFBEB2|nr:pyridoxamine 5'-phosphate oxidase family protein [Novosphingobium sp. FKTRR1]
MEYQQGKPEELRETFWKALESSPIVLLQLDDDAASAAPMVVQLDAHAHHTVWFLTSKNSRFAAVGPATATFASKGHDVFARITGVLTTETDRTRLDDLWNPAVAAWFPGGKDDPNLLLLRMNLGDAAIWSGKVGALDYVRMALGLNVTDQVKGSYTETAL